MKQLFLSIITPTYNRANKLHTAFESLNAQTNKDFEWIIVDDGSVDNTCDVVSEFIKNATFPIVYKKIKHGGKHFATRAGYELAHGKYSFELDSDDELYTKNTIDEIYKMAKSIPENYSYFGGCFINQQDKISPKFDGEYMDFDRDKYMECFCDTVKIDMLNAPWIMKMEYAKSVLPPAINDNLNYYPEAVVNVGRVLKCRDFHMRLFNKPIYRYYICNDDSVSVNTHKTNADWYYARDLLKLFYKYNLLDKYPCFTERIVKKLFNATTKNKNILDVYRILKSVGQWNRFYQYFFKYLIKTIFSVKRVGTDSVITIFGFKIKGCKK